MSKEMIISRYIYQKRFSDGSVGIYSTKTGNCVYVDKKWAGLLVSGLLARLPSSVINELTQAGILVEDGTNELEQVLSQRRWNPNVFRILTTTSCNAACSYCYEKGIQPMTMDHVIAEETAAFLSRRLEASGDNVLLLEWFGGEPLLNMDAIDRICDSLQERKIQFRSALTTNGALLLPEAVSLIRDKWSLSRVQIGLDGIGKNHEQIKGLSTGSFSRTIESIHRLLEISCRVSIRIVHLGDIPRESALIAFLAKEFPVDKPDVYLFPLYGVSKRGLRDAMEEILTLEQQLAEAGFLCTEKMHRFRQRCGKCFAADGGITVAPDGHLFSCSHAMKEEYCIGTVWDFKEDNKVYRSFTAPDLPRHCMACAYLPFCMGGCRAAERDMAEMFQCHPYSTVMDIIINEYFQNRV